MELKEAIHTRRSIRKFTDRAVEKSEIESMIAAAVTAPNHKLTEPWEFVVLGPAARAAYGAVLGRRKAKKVEDPAAAAQLVQKVADEHAAKPGMIAVVMRLDDNPETREEDYASTFMAVENLCLRAVDLGLGTHLKSGAVMEDPGAREVGGVAEGHRIVVLIEFGQPAEEPPARARTPGEQKTRWLP